ncbi:MAG TPA: hypothetical protein VKS44_17300 [Candidatus Acidoferrales bacterium]|nr:hypothetical protein [Candidatus Acidoferrales bacterium]
MPPLFSSPLGTLAGEGSLTLGYDIFEALKNGEVIWVGCAGTLDEAKSRAGILGSTGSSRYFVRDASTGKIVADTAIKDLGEACA